MIAGFAALTPYLFVADSWMTLLSGREVVRNGIPDTETLTVLASGREWVDQQWLAQAVFYLVELAAGLPGVAMLHVLLIGGTLGSCMAAARLLGASARATFLVAIPILLTAPWSWQLRAQSLALPLFVWTLWLAADHVRHPSRRIAIAIPLLLVWANVHGSVLLGALIVSLAVVVVAARRARDSREIGIAAALGLGAWACVLVTPYGLDIVGYYHLLIVDPPFGDAIVEWQRTTPNALTAFFFGVAFLSAVVVAWKRRRLTWFEIAVLAILLAGALDAVRGIVWFSLAVAVLVPNALDGVFRKPDRVQYPRMNVALAGAFVAATLVTLVVVISKGNDWFEQRWPEGVLAAVRSAGPDARVYPSDRYADWILWRMPELRGRVAYDVRFELLTRETFLDVARFDSESGADWKRVADGYKVVIVDEDSVPSHTSKLLAEPGARTAFHDEEAEVTVIHRPREAA